MEEGTRARHLRNNPTDAESRLWQVLSARKLGGFRFNRQRVRPFICDFVARTPRLIVEVDGGQHALDAEQDARRTRYLESKGYRVIRFWNNDVLENLEGVVAEIERALAALPSPSPSRSAVGGRLRRGRGASAPLPLAGGAGGGDVEGNRQP